MAPLEPNGPGPYTTANSVTTIVDAFRDRGLGVPITTAVITRAGVGETIANRTLSSLKVLGLVDEQGGPSEQFEDFRRIRGQEEFQARFAEWLRGVYADVLQYTDPSVDPASKVAEAFRTYEPAGRRTQMAALLIGLWRYAGLPVPEIASSARTPRPPKKSTATPKPTKVTANKTEPEVARDPIPQGLPPALLGLLQQVPPAGEGWTVERRKVFMDAFTAVLDFTIPIVETAKATEEDIP